MLGGGDVGHIQFHSVTQGTDIDESIFFNEIPHRL
jgi:hypothetical protein